MITELDAYKAMFHFLDAYWERNDKPDELGLLLSCLALQKDGLPGDAAMWDEWKESLKAVGLTEPASLPDRP